MNPTEALVGGSYSFQAWRTGPVQTHFKKKDIPLPLTGDDSSRGPLRKEPPLLSGLREKKVCLEAGNEWARLTTK